MKHQNRPIIPPISPKHELVTTEILLDDKQYFTFTVKPAWKAPLYNKSLSIKSTHFSRLMNNAYNCNLYIKGNCSQRPHFKVLFSGLYIQVWLYSPIDHLHIPDLILISNVLISHFNYYHWVDTSAAWLLARPRGYHRSVVSVLALLFITTFSS